MTTDHIGSDLIHRFTFLCRTGWRPLATHIHLCLGEHLLQLHSTGCFSFHRPPRV